MSIFSGIFEKNNEAQGKNQNLAQAEAKPARAKRMKAVTQVGVTRNSTTGRTTRWRKFLPSATKGRNHTAAYKVVVKKKS